jgi:hypothetical protein
MTAAARSRMVRGAQPGVWALRGTLVAGILLALLAGLPEGRVPPVWLVVVLVLSAVLSAFRPEHLAMAMTLGVVLVWWAFAIGDGMPMAALVAAAGLTAAHVAATLLGYGPPSLPVDPRLALLWTGRGVLAWLAALVVWGVARTYSGHGTPALFWLTGLAAALVAAVVAGVTVPVRGEGEGE